MAKRFTDNEKWKKQWFRKLPCEMKLFWCYICDNCNIAGIWEVDMEVASFFIGSTISEEYALSCMEKQISVISHSKWMINDFVGFQYGNLVPNNNLHKSVISLLEKSGASQGLVSPKAGDKVKVKDKVKVINTTNNIYTKFVPPTLEEVESFCLSRNNKVDPKAFFDKNTSIGWVDKNGNKYKDWKAVVRLWESYSNAVAAPKQPLKRPILMVVLELIAAGMTNHEIKHELVGKYVEKDIDEAVMKVRSGKVE